MVRALAYSPDTCWSGRGLVRRRRRWQNGVTTRIPVTRTGSSAGSGSCSWTFGTRYRSGSSGRSWRRSGTRYDGIESGASNARRASTPSGGRTPPRRTRWSSRPCSRGTRRLRKGGLTRGARYWRGSGSCSSSGSSERKRPTAGMHTFVGRRSVGSSFSAWSFSGCGFGTRSCRSGRRCRKGVAGGGGACD